MSTCPRLYIDAELTINSSISLDERHRHHLLNVLRLKTGTDIVLFNDKGGEYTATLQISGKRADAHIHRFNDTHRESPLDLHLVQAVSRGDRMDFTLQKAVELGVNKITPVFSERSIRKPDDKQLSKKFNHWKGIVISACEQSGRCKLPILNPPVDFTEWLAARYNSNVHRFILDPAAAENFKPEGLTSIALMIGPEGGFSDKEIEYAISKGWTSVTLGPRILRTETAGIVAVTVCQALSGDLLGNF